MQRFEMAAVLNELLGEVIEQFGFCGLAAGEAEVARTRDEALAEVMLPDAVGDDTPRQRVVGSGDPFGEGFAAKRGLGGR